MAQYEFNGYTASRLSLLNFDRKNINPEWRLPTLFELISLSLLKTCDFHIKCKQKKLFLTFIPLETLNRLEEVQNGFYDRKQTKSWGYVKDLSGYMWKVTIGKINIKFTMVEYLVVNKVLYRCPDRHKYNEFDCADCNNRNAFLEYRNGDTTEKSKFPIPAFFYIGEYTNEGVRKCVHCYIVNVVKDLKELELFTKNFFENTHFYSEKMKIEYHSKDIT